MRNDLSIEQMRWWMHQSCDVREGFVKGELVASDVRRRWTTGEDGIIHLTLPMTKGVSGRQWFDHFNTEPCFEGFFESEDFLTTSGIIYDIAILPSNLDYLMVKKNDWKDGVHIGPEIGCLLRSYLSDQDIAFMGFDHIMVMHKPIQNEVFGNPDHKSLICVSGVPDDSDFCMYQPHQNRTPEKLGHAVVVSQKTLE